MSLSQPDIPRRRYSNVEKRRIVELSLRDGARLRDIAQHHGICQTTLSNWRKKYREAKHIAVDEVSEKTASPKFFPISVVTPKIPSGNRILVRIDLPSGALVRIQSDTLDFLDLATLLSTPQQ